MDGRSLAEALFGKKADEVWQDREVRFDVAPAQLQCRRGEEVLETFVSTLCLWEAASSAATHAAAAAVAAACNPKLLVHLSPAPALLQLTILQATSAFHCS